MFFLVPKKAGCSATRNICYILAMNSEPHSRAESLLGAAEFAARKHKGQRRKDVEAIPYINHPIAVAELLARVGEVTDLALLQAALLHDTVEDTDATPEEIEARFGKEVRLLVQEVTDDKALPQAERRRLQVEHASRLSQRARLLKLADKICNLSDLSSVAPVGWSVERKRGYMDWAESVVAGLRGAHPGLEKLFDKTVSEKRRLLG
jgi:guanosine-3',5'-bis(diphosphate) 3'-pyrophosphohydrolase